jgi:hypothetical protein
MDAAVRYADGIAEGGLPRFWTELSYHRYRGVSREVLQEIADRAATWKLSTSMLEHIGADYHELHEDLGVGGVSAWQQFTLAFPTRDNGAQYYIVDSAGPAGAGIRIGQRTRFLRQYFRYIRSGAVRIGAATSDADFDPLAFVNPDGAFVVVVKAQRGGEFGIQGLPAGRYEVTSTTPRAPDMRVGSFTLDEGEVLRTSIPARGVLTVFGS